MESKRLQELAVNALSDLKAIDPTIIDVRPLTTITDVMIVCSGRSNRHVRSIAENLVTEAKKHHVQYVHLEGDKENEWVLVDMGDIVVHIMLPEVRAFYNLEALWEPMGEMQTQEAR